MQGINGCDTRIIWSGTLSPYNTDVDKVNRERAEWEEKLGPSGDNMFVIQCECCANLFWSGSGNAKFCSTKCRKETASAKAHELTYQKHKYLKDKKSLYARLTAQIDNQYANQSEKRDRIMERLYIMNSLQTCQHYSCGTHGLKCFYCKKGLDYPSMKPRTGSDCCSEVPVAPDGKVYLYDTVDKTDHRVRYAILPGVGRTRVDKSTKNLYYINGSYYIKNGEELTEWKLPKQ